MVLLLAVWPHIPVTLATGEWEVQLEPAPMAAGMVRVLYYVVSINFDCDKYLFKTGHAHIIIIKQTTLTN